MTLLSNGGGFPPDWQHDFKAAICSGQLQEAKTVIFLRLKAKAERPPSILERVALNDAIHLLRALRSENVSRADIADAAR